MRLLFRGYRGIIEYTADVQHLKSYSPKYPIFTVVIIHGDLETGVTEYLCNAVPPINHNTIIINRACMVCNSQIIIKHVCTHPLGTMGTCCRPV